MYMVKYYCKILNKSGKKNVYWLPGLPDWKMSKTVYFSNLGWVNGDEVIFLNLIHLFGFNENQWTECLCTMMILVGKKLFVISARQKTVKINRDCWKLWKK